MLRPRANRRGQVASVLISLVLMLGAGWFFLNRDYVYDLYSYWQYQPTDAVSSIADRAALSDQGKFYLYASHAAINNAADFNLNCQRLEAGNAVLGCYNTGRIYIYDVNSQELDGIKEVTAAHEMLHAAWARLSGSEKERLSALLETAYQANATDELRQRMDYYGRNEAGEKYNELHSIIGTEVASLDSELENYYSKYFTDRRQTVALFDKYNSVFVRLAAESEALHSELVTLESNISRLKNQYDSSVADLNQDIDAYETRANNGDYSSRSEMMLIRDQLLARIDEVNAMYRQLSNQIALYNTKYDKYQELMVRSASLNTAIDSTLAPVPSL